MDIKEIERAMHTLACGDTNFDTVSRLASLVIVHDHLSAAAQQEPFAYSTEPRMAPPNLSGSDFLDAVSGAPLEDVLRVLDEHMEALRVVIPAEYDTIMRKLHKL